MNHTNQAQFEAERIAQSQAKLKLTPVEWVYIKRVGLKLNRLYTNSCNGFPDALGNWDAKAETKNDQTIIKWERKAEQFAKSHRLYLYLQTDPRGATIYLDHHPIPKNNYTTAVCVY